MTFADFKVAYTATFRRMMSYTSDQVGSVTYAEEMAKLADAYPEWAEKVEQEAVSGPTERERIEMCGPDPVRNEELGL